MTFREYRPQNAGTSERYLIEVTDDGRAVVSRASGKGDWCYLFDAYLIQGNAEQLIEVWRGALPPGNLEGET